MTDPIKPPARADVELLSARTVGENYGRLFNYVLRHRRFDGGWLQVARDCFDSGPAVCVLPYDPRRDEVVLVRQFRTGPWIAGDEPWIYECPAGRIDRTATAEEIAHSEAREEAGLTLSALEPLGHFFASPGIFSERIQAFCGRIEGDAQGGVFGLDHEHEDIEAKVFAADEAVAMAIDGRIVAAPAVICLLRFAAIRERLRSEWR
jgi:ADP-ribose pyrophosphatase